MTTIVMYGLIWAMTGELLWFVGLFDMEASERVTLVGLTLTSIIVDGVLWAFEDTKNEIEYRPSRRGD